MNGAVNLVSQKLGIILTRTANGMSLIHMVIIQNHSAIELLIGIIYPQFQDIIQRNINKMTCVIAYRRNINKIILASDKMASNYYSKQITKESKIFEKNGFHIGCTTSFRMIQILKHIWYPPDRKIKQNTEQYLYKDVVESIRACFKANGFGDATKEVYGNFILIYENRIFEMQNDLSLMESEMIVTAVGSGEDYAIASIMALLSYEKNDKKLLTRTFDIISSVATTVSKEFEIITIGE